MPSEKIVTRRKPTSPLHSGILDPEQILKEARKIRRSLSSPSLFTPGQLESSSSFTYSELKIEEGKLNISWLVPSTLVESFQILTTPLSSKKQKLKFLVKLPYFSLSRINSFLSQVRARLVNLFLH